MFFGYQRRSEYDANLRWWWWWWWPLRESKLYRGQIWPTMLYGATKVLITDDGGFHRGQRLTDVKYGKLTKVSSDVFLSILLKSRLPQTLSFWYRRFRIDTSICLKGWPTRLGTLIHIIRYVDIKEQMIFIKSHLQLNLLNHTFGETKLMNYEPSGCRYTYSLAYNLLSKCKRVNEQKHSF